MAPGAERIEEIARAAISKLPPEFVAHLGNVVLHIEDFADDETLAEMGIENPFELTGLYSGLAVGSKSVGDSGTMPDMIHLYRRAILDEWVETGVTLEALVAHVVIHEIGHHFGLSDDDMHRLEELAG